MADVAISADEKGRPIASFRDSSDPRPMPCVSISHSKNLVASVASFNHWVGVDVELIEPRGEGFERVAFDDEERRILDALCEMGTPRDELVTRLWSAKEAYCKAWGEGMTAGPRTAVVRGMDCSSGEVQMAPSDALQAAVPQCKTWPARVITRRHGEYAFALCWVAAEAAAS